MFVLNGTKSNRSVEEKCNLNTKMQKVLEISQKNFDAAFSLNLAEVKKNTMENQIPMRWDGFMSECPPPNYIPRF